MALRYILAFAVLSAAGIIPAASRGQSVQVPRSFNAYPDGRDLIARWTSTDAPDLFQGEVDEDPQFDSPSRFLVESDGRGSYERRLRDLRDGTYYVRVRALETFAVIRVHSDWTHVERVVIGGRSGDIWRDDGDDEGWERDGDRDVDGSPGRDARRFPVGNDRPDRVEVWVVGDDVRVGWNPVRSAQGYVLQLDTDRRFRQARSFSVGAWEERRLQEFRIRNVPPGRFYLRVRAVDSFVSRDRTRWSDVVVVDVERWDRDRDRDREADFYEGRHVTSKNGRSPLLFEDRRGRGNGKGHLYDEGKRRIAGNDRDRGKRGEDDRKDDDRDGDEDFGDD
jgi:hypothetical protein